MSATSSFVSSTVPPESRRYSRAARGVLRGVWYPIAAACRAGSAVRSWGLLGHDPRKSGAVGPAPVRRADRPTRVCAGWWQRCGRLPCGTRGCPPETRARSWTASTAGFRRGRGRARRRALRRGHGGAVFAAQTVSGRLCSRTTRSSRPAPPSSRRAHSMSWGRRNGPPPAGRPRPARGSRRRSGRAGRGDRPVPRLPTVTPRPFGIKEWSRSFARDPPAVTPRR